MALGGAFASRLNQRVRDDLGLTYGISSGFEARKFQGPFLMDTFTRNDKVGETIGASLEVYRTFVEKGLSEEELQASKSVIVGQFPRAVETMDALAYQMLLLRYYGIPDSYLTQFVKNVNALSLVEVNAAIKKYFRPDQLDIVVYGDSTSVEKQLKKFGAVQKL
jgi:zinc protease